MSANPITLTKIAFGDQYPEKIKPLISELHELSKKWGLTPIKTMLRACDEMEKQGASGVDIGMVIAAYVEDVEGTFLEK